MTCSPKGVYLAPPSSHKSKRATTPDSMEGFFLLMRKQWTLPEGVLVCVLACGTLLILLESSRRRLRRLHEPTPRSPCPQMQHLLCTQCARLLLLLLVGASVLHAQLSPLPGWLEDQRGLHSTQALLWAAWCLSAAQGQTCMLAQLALPGCP